MFKKEFSNLEILLCLNKNLLFIIYHIKIYQEEKYKISFYCIKLKNFWSSQIHLQMNGNINLTESYQEKRKEIVLLGVIEILIKFRRLLLELKVEIKKNIFFIFKTF